MLDPRTVLNQLMEQGRSQVEKEIEVEQVRHVPLEEYREGHPHYEMLMSQLATAQRFQWPSDGFQVNV